MTTRDGNVRRRASILLAGAVALSATGCTLFESGEDPTTSSSTHAPLTTTTTTAPSTSTSTSDGGTVKNPPSGKFVLAASRTFMEVNSNVTISGKLHDTDRDLDVTIRAEGSTGGLKSQRKDAGRSIATLSVKGGGKMETITMGYDHYVKVNKQWLDTLEAKRDSPMRKNLDRWVKVPFDNSPLDPYRPQQLLKQAYYGKGLTPYDAVKSPASIEELNGEETYRVAIRKATDKGGGQERILWVSTDAQAPRPIRMTYGENAQRSTLNYSKWNSSREDFTKPAKFKVVEDVTGDDL